MSGKKPEIECFSEKERLRWLNQTLAFVRLTLVLLILAVVWCAYRRMWGPMTHLLPAIASNCFALITIKLAGLLKPWDKHDDRERWRESNHEP